VAKVVSQSIHQNPEAAVLATDPEQAPPPPPAAAKAPVIRNTPKVGRNDPCPCGSGQKYKACHGKLEV